MPRRPFLLSNNASGALGHADGVYPRSMASPITIDTNADWSPVTQDGAVVDSNAVKLSGSGREDFWGYGTGSYTNGPGDWEGNYGGMNINEPFGAVDDRAWGGYESTTSTWYLKTDAFPAEQFTDTLGWCYYEDTNNTVTRMALYSSSGDKIVDMGTDNPEAKVVSPSGTQTLRDSGNYDRWREFRFTIDWDAKTADITWNDIGGSTTSASTTVDLFAASTYDIDRIEFYHSQADGFGGGGQVDFYTTRVAPSPVTRNEEGTLTTQTKTFDSAIEPSLTDMVYSLSGADISLDVIGSPGTASEEIHSTGLSGEAEWSPSWANSHTDFRVKPRMQSDDKSNIPTLDSLTLTP
jgi:hypothetical protein